MLLGAGFIPSVDFSILNVELPRIGTAFGLPAAGSTLVCGRLADLFGRRRVFLSGVPRRGLNAAARY
ncbi:hypothetical protein [Saccharopolyspora shandongensis]|uniref:hypothetical protein n=1 Tax=Saccharopolyspora shandongensis TaxID=418495 RepID=UPI00340622AD